MKIINFNSHDDIFVEFQDEYRAKIHTSYQAFKKGNVKNPYDKENLGIGFLGIGKYHNFENGKKQRAYQVWHNIIERCYGEYYAESHVAYYGICTMCEDWFNYQNFAQWYHENYYDIGEGRMHLDKDLLVKDNTLYSPERCVFLPQRINMIFMTHQRTIDSDLPAGIKRSYLSNGNVRFNTLYNGKTIGTYDTLEEAIERQLIVKREHIKGVAKEYKNKIPIKIYEALLVW